MDFSITRSKKSCNDAQTVCVRSVDERKGYLNNDIQEWKYVRYQMYISTLPSVHYILLVITLIFSNIQL